MRILFVTPYVPSRLRPRPLHLIQGLAAAGDEVHLLAVATEETPRADVAALADSCGSVRIIRIPRWRSLANSARGLATRAPLQAWYCRSPQLESELRAALAARSFDIVHFEHVRTAFAALHTNGIAAVFDAVDCISLLHEDTLRHGRALGSRVTARVELRRTQNFERRLVEHFRCVFVASERDRRRLLEVARPDAGADDELPARVRLLTSGVDGEYFRPSAPPRSQPPQIVFVGRLGYHANRAAVGHLLREIMPRVWKHEPRARLTIVGADAPPALQRSAQASGDRVVVTGYVDDIRPYLNEASVAVAPLPYSVGIQNKVLEAMAMGIPVVASPAAVAALQAVPGQDLVVADGDEEFAAQIAQLCADERRRKEIGAAGRRYVERHHSWTEATKLLQAAYRDRIAAN